MDSDEWVYRNGMIKMGEVAWTLPGNLINCRVIIHAALPIWSNVYICSISTIFRGGEMIN
jgi:hypothetical protein